MNPVTSAQVFYRKCTPTCLRNMTATSEPRLCTCTHWDDVHVRLTGRCKGIDSYGLPCGCPSLEIDPSCLELGDEDDDEIGGALG